MVVIDGWLRMDSPATPQRFRAWGSAYVSSHVASSVWIREGCTSFEGRLRRRRLCDLVLIDIEADPFGVRFERDSEVSRYMGFSVNNRPFSERVIYDDSTEEVQTSSVDVWDAAALVESEVLTPMAQTLVLMPKSALGLTEGTPLVPRAALRQPEFASLRILRDLLLAVAGQTDHLGPAAAAAARNAIVELLLVVAREYSPAAGVVANGALRLSVCRWVDEHLHRGVISPEGAADYHGISVRSLQRLFAETGETFRSLVRRRRLDRARRDVLGTDHMIQSIALRWGYADASHLIHDFKQVHGTTPMVYRQECRAGAQKGLTVA